MGSRVSESSYLTKKSCPVCKVSFESEKLLAKKISPKSWDASLRNVYATAPPVEPLLYVLVTCPQCLFTASEGDFDDPKISANAGLSQVTAESRKVLDSLGIKLADMKGLKDFRIGLAQYYLAELWYDARRNLPIRLFRLGLTLYRRAWLLEPALAAGIITLDHCRHDRKYCLHTAENYLEQSYLSERLPDNLFCGPDYGVNFGQAALPYIVAWINYTMAVNDAEYSGAERIVHHKKSAKFLGLVLSALSRGGAQELRNKASDLKDMLKAAEKSIPSSEPEPRAPVAGTPAPPVASTAHVAKKLESFPAETFTPETEVVEWELQFDALMDKYGEVYEQGAAIITEGEESSDLFLIIEGKVHVVKTYFKLAESSSKLIAVLARGAFFGEMSLLDSSPRSATVVAVEPTSVIRINHFNLQAIIQTYPDIAIRIMTILAKRLRNYDSFVQYQLIPLLRDVQNETAEPSRQIDIRKNLRVELEGLLQEVRDKAYS
ncbi:MAG: DUF2225 domain-containing protein [Candidatus Hydrogenedentota bacterium]